jgi:hypothetical protein
VVAGSAEVMAEAAEAMAASEAEANNSSFVPGFGMWKPTLTLHGCRRSCASCRSSSKTSWLNALCCRPPPRRLLRRSRVLSSSKSLPLLTPVVPTESRASAAATPPSAARQTHHLSSPSAAYSTRIGGLTTVPAGGRRGVPSARFFVRHVGLVQWGAAARAAGRLERRARGGARAKKID